MKTTKNTRENCVALFKAMKENKQGIISDLREKGYTTADHLYSSLLHEIITLDTAIECLTSKSDFSTYWDIYRPVIDEIAE